LFAPPEIDAAAFQLQAAEARDRDRWNIPRLRFSVYRDRITLRLVSGPFKVSKNTMKMLITGLLIGLGVGALTTLYFSLSTFFAVQNQRRIVAIREPDNRVAEAESKPRKVAQTKEAQAGK
jgi:hypothetical protein